MEERQLSENLIADCIASPEQEVHCKSAPGVYSYRLFFSGTVDIADDDEEEDDEEYDPGLDDPYHALAEPSDYRADGQLALDLRQVYLKKLTNIEQSTKTSE